MPFLCVHTEGGLIPADILEQIAAGEVAGQQPTDFGLPRSVRLMDEIAAAWADARAYWEAFGRGLGRIPKDDPATTVTREQWVLPLLRSLGYDTITFMPRAVVIGSSTYAISHRAGPDESTPPLHLAGCRIDLEDRPPTGRPRLSAHGLLQEYLNRAEDLWGVVTNGYRLRLLRDSALMTRPSYVEFDLQQMMAGEQFADFALFYRLVHRSRLPLTADKGDECWLEKYHQQAIDQGGRVRDRLRDGVENALQLLGSGFLQHPANGSLRDKLHSGQLPATAYYRQLLRLVYRLLFLMVSEERKLIGPDDPRLAVIYWQHYSLDRLRGWLESHPSADERHSDLWLGLTQTFRLFEDEDLARRMGMHALDGDLFGPAAVPDLETAQLHNAALLSGLRRLSLYRDKEDRVTRRVNYGALDVEELGSVYESLLEYHPVVEERDGRPTFAFVLGSDRKTTGSYYTRPELVHELIKSALEPVIEERLNVGLKPHAGLLRDPTRRGEKELESALLSIKVCDPAAGSGHFLLAAARRLGRELARLRTGEEHPGPEAFRRAVRDVIGHCIYGVDKNPLAVDLCKVALWLEAHNRGLPLTFLDHRIKLGDSLVGVLDLQVLDEGLPDEAYTPVSGDDKAVASGLKKRNKQEREGQMTLSGSPVTPDLSSLSDPWRRLSETPDDAVDAIRAKQRDYDGARAQGSAWWTLWTACNLWTAAFFTPLGKGVGDRIATTATVRDYLQKPRAANGQLVGAANGLAAEARFFHWPLEFPDVFSGGGFDVVLSNPPWDIRQAEEEQFFVSRSPQIAQLEGDNRKKAIARLRETDQALYAAWLQYKRGMETEVKFLRASSRFPHLSGKVNLYGVFAHLLSQLPSRDGRSGILVPTGIATDDTNKHFFADLVNNGRLASLYDFENREKLFAAVDSRYKFSLLTVRGQGDPQRAAAEFVFFATRTAHLADQRRRFTLTRADFARINPNTRTCPIFRTRQDAELTRKIYERVPVLVNEETGENPWGITFRQGLFNMTSDSHLFRTREQLERAGFHLESNRFALPSPSRRGVGGEVWLPLYEAKMMWQFDHRFGTYQGVDSRSSTHLPTPSLAQYAAPTFVALPCYWVPAAEVRTRLGNWERAWLLGFRDITNATNERTAIFSPLPRVGVGHTMPLMFSSGVQSHFVACLAAGINTLVSDYNARQKIGGTHLTYNYLRQLPVLPPSAYSFADFLFIVPRVLELVYTAWDIKAFADDVWRDAAADAGLRAAIKAQWDANANATGGHVGAQPPPWALPSPFGRGAGGEGFPHPPFKWDEDRRAVLRAELDALYARLYGLTEEELRYILDPADVYGPDFPGETFRVLKEKEIRQYGEYRTRRLVLEAWGRLGNTKDPE